MRWRHVFKLLFFVFDPLAILVAFHGFRVDWRNPAIWEYEEMFGILLLICFVIIGVSSFALRRTDKHISKIGLVTIVAIVLIAALFPAL
jgi:hypothetical protein